MHGEPLPIDFFLNLFILLFLPALPVVANGFLNFILNHMLNKEDRLKNIVLCMAFIPIMGGFFQVWNYIEFDRVLVKKYDQKSLCVIKITLLIACYLIWILGVVNLNIDIVFIGFIFGGFCTVTQAIDSFSFFKKKGHADKIRNISHILNPAVVQ